MCGWLFFLEESVCSSMVSLFYFYFFGGCFFEVLTTVPNKNPKLQTPWGPLHAERDMFMFIHGVCIFFGWVFRGFDNLPPTHKKPKQLLKHRCSHFGCQAYLSPQHLRPLFLDGRGCHLTTAPSSSSHSHFEQCQVCYSPSCAPCQPQSS